MPRGLLLSIWLACGCASSTPPGVVRPEPGQTLESIPGPFAQLGPETDPDTAIIKACAVVMALPNTFIPVNSNDMNFNTYWSVSTEYCAWQYSPDGQHIWTSLFAMSAVQDDPSKRICTLPANVVDSRYPGAEVLYLTVIHNHTLMEPSRNKLSSYDHDYLDEMVRRHYAQTVNGVKTVVFPRVNGKQVPMRIVAFFGRQTPEGLVECAGFYEFTWGTPQILKVTQDKDGHWHKEPVDP